MILDRLRRRRTAPAPGEADEVHRPLTGASAALLSRMIGRALGLALIVVLAREQDTQTFAAYSYLLVLAASVSVITDIGVALVVGRDVAHGSLDPATGYRVAALPHIAVNVLAAAGVVVVATVLPGPGAGFAAIAWSAVFVFVNGIFNLQTELLRGMGRYWPEATLQVVSALLQAVLGVAVVLAGMGLSALFAVLTVKQLVVVVAAHVLLPTPTRAAGAAAPPGLRRSLLRRGFLLGAATTLGTVSGRLPQVVLGNIAGPAEVAGFAVATRYLEVIQTIAYTAGLGLLPALARAAGRGRASAHADRRVVTIAVLIATAFAIPGVLLVPWLTEAVFGHRYAGAAAASQVFVASSPLLAGAILAQYVLVAQQEERAVLYGSAFALVASIAACYAFLLQQSSVVAALVTTVTSLTSAAYLVTSALRNPKLQA